MPRHKTVVGLVMLAVLLIWNSVCRLIVVHYGKDGCYLPIAMILGMWGVLALSALTTLRFLFLVGRWSVWNLTAMLVVAAVSLLCVKDLIKWRGCWLDGFAVYVNSQWSQSRLQEIAERVTASVPENEYNQWLFFQDSEAAGALTLDGMTPRTRVFVGSNGHSVVILEWGHGRYPTHGLIVFDVSSDTSSLVVNRAWRDAAPGIRIFVNEYE